MRRKTPSSNNGSYNNNQPRKPRFQQGGSGGERPHNQHYNSGHNRPRKNYSAMREKYLAQARDALAAGDRVLAENYFQHADHCYRMMVEEGYFQRNNFTPVVQADGTQAPQTQDEAASEANMDGNTEAQLPAFLTAGYGQSEQEKVPEPVSAQNWEE